MRVSTIILSLFPNIKKLFVHLFTPSKENLKKKMVLKYENKHKPIYENGFQEDDDSIPVH